MFFPPEHDDERISAFIDGQMTAQDRAEFVAAMQSNPLLKQRVEEFQRLSTELRELPLERLPEDFADQLLATADFQNAWTERFGQAGSGRSPVESVDAANTRAPAVFSEWSVAIAAIGALAAMLLLTLFWPALFDSGVSVVANRADESSVGSAEANQDQSSAPAMDSADRGSDAFARDDVNHIAGAGLMAKSGDWPSSGAELAMKDDGSTALRPNGITSPMQAIAPGPTDTPAKGRMRRAESGAENVRGDQAAGQSAINENATPSPRAQMALDVPEANRMVDDPVDAGDFAGQSEMAKPDAAPLTVEPDRSGRFSQHAEGEFGAGRALESNELPMTNAVGPLNVVQVNIQDDPASIAFLERVFVSNRLVVMPNQLAIPSGVEMSQSRDMADGDRNMESHHEKSGAVAPGASAIAGQTEPISSETTVESGYVLGNDTEALYAIASPEQMQKVVMELSARAQVSMFRLSEDELTNQVVTMPDPPQVEARDGREDKEADQAAETVPPTFILNFSQRMEMGPAKQAKQGHPGQGHSDSVAPRTAPANEAARSTVPNEPPMAKRAGNSKTGAAEAVVEDDTSRANADSEEGRSLESPRPSRSIDGSGRNAAPGNSTVVPEGVDPWQIRQLNAYFDLPTPDGATDQPLPRKEQFILLIRRLPAPVVSGQEQDEAGDR